MSDCQEEARLLRPYFGCETDLVNLLLRSGLKEFRTPGLLKRNSCCNHLKCGFFHRNNVQVYNVRIPELVSMGSCCETQSRINGLASRPCMGVPTPTPASTPTTRTTRQPWNSVGGETGLTAGASVKGRASARRVGRPNGKRVSANQVNPAEFSSCFLAFVFGCSYRTHPDKCG